MSHELDQEPDEVDACDSDDEKQTLQHDDRDSRGRRRRDRIRTACAVVVAFIALWQAVRNGV